MTNAGPSGKIIYCTGIFFQLEQHCIVGYYKLLPLFFPTVSNMSE